MLFAVLPGHRWLVRDAPCPCAATLPAHLTPGPRPAPPPCSFLSTWAGGLRKAAQRLIAGYPGDLFSCHSLLTLLLELAHVDSPAVNALWAGPALPRLVLGFLQGFLGTAAQAQRLLVAGPRTVQRVALRGPQEDDLLLVEACFALVAGVLPSAGAWRNEAPRIDGMTAYACARLSRLSLVPRGAAEAAGSRALWPAAIAPGLPNTPHW